MRTFIGHHDIVSHYGAAIELVGWMVMEDVKPIPFVREKLSGHCEDDIKEQERKVTELCQLVARVCADGDLTNKIKGVD